MNQQNLPRKLSPIRSCDGFSLATVLCIGVLAGLWMLGTAALVIPATLRVTKEKAQDLARSSAEAGLDWAVAQLNDPVLRTSIDGQTVEIPSAVLAVSTFTGSVRVDNFSAPSSSYLYDQTCDWGKSTWNSSPTGATCNNVYGGNGWRIITAGVSAGPAGSRSVRVILKPVYTSTTQSTWGVGTPTPFFNWAIQSGQGVSGNGNLVTDSYTSTNTNPQPSGGFTDSDGDVVTNGQSTFGGHARIGGNLEVYANGTGAVALGNQVTVAEDVITNGTAIGNIAGIEGQYQPNAGAHPASFPPVPPAPSAAVQTSINLSGNDSLTLTAGDYVVPAISIHGNGTLNIDSSQGPVNIYVTGSGASAGITIGGNGIANSGRPTNFRIWYPGSGNVQIGGNGNLSGTIYAPNAPVKFNGNGSMFGGIVASTISIVGNPNFHYDRSLQAQGPMYYPPALINKQADMINYYQAVSWDEL